MSLMLRCVVGEEGKGSFGGAYVYFGGGVVVIVLVIVESEMEVMNDVAVRSEHSLVDERGFGGISGCYKMLSYCCIWYSYHYSTVMNEGESLD